MALPQPGMTPQLQRSMPIPANLSHMNETDAQALVQLAEQERLKKEREARIISWVDAEVHKCRNARAAFERQWYLNISFYSGKQYNSPVEVPGQGFRLTVPKAPPWRVRSITNLIRGAVLKECSKLTSSKPIPTVVPATNEDEDQTAAIVSEAILKSHFANAKFEEIYRQWVWWGTVCGVSFIKSYYDPSELDYDSMQLPAPLTMPDGSPLPEEIVAQIPGLKEKLETPEPAKGKICFERITPFHLFVPDMLCENIQNQPYIIHQMTRTPEWIKSKFGFKPTCDSRAANSIIDAAVVIAKGGQDSYDSVIVTEVWIKPGSHSDFPEGGLITIINNKAVQMFEHWPTPFAEYPFYKFNGMPTGGFYTESRVTDMIPIQKEYNRTRSQMMEIKNVMGKPKIMYPKGSINPRQISTEPGQSIPYQAGYAPPVVLPGAEVPNSMWSEVEQIRSEFNDISAQHDISNGSAPTGVSSGTAIAYLQEQDDTILSYQVAGIEYACELLGTHYLKYVTKYWDNDRIIKVTGRNNSFESIHWKKSAAEGNTDVRVQTGSALPTSKAAKQALITEMMQNGFLDPAVGLEILDMGAFEKAMEDILVDKKQATRENLKMQDAPDKILELLMSPPPGPNGENGFTHPESGLQLDHMGQPFQPQAPIPVNSWDNHDAHITLHNNFRKTQEFEQLSETKKRAFELHVQTHQMSIMSAQVNSQGLMLQPGQAPPPPEQGMPPEGPPDGGPGGPPSNSKMPGKQGEPPANGGPPDKGPPQKGQSGPPPSSQQGPPPGPR